MWIYTATSHLYASFTEVILRGAVNWNNWTSFKTREGIMDCSIMRNMSWASSLTSRSSMMNAQSFILPLLPVRCVHTWDGFLLYTWWLTWWVSCGFESLARCQVPCMLLRLLCCAPHTHTHLTLLKRPHTWCWRLNFRFGWLRRLCVMGDEWIFAELWAIRGTRECGDFFLRSACCILCMIESL